jgi:hypothetical protein
MIWRIAINVLSQMKIPIPKQMLRLRMFASEIDSEATAMITIVVPVI